MKYVKESLPGYPAPTYTTKAGALAGGRRRAANPRKRLMVCVESSVYRDECGLDEHRILEGDLILKPEMIGVEQLESGFWRWYATYENDDLSFLISTPNGVARIPFRQYVNWKGPRTSSGEPTLDPEKACKKSEVRTACDSMTSSRYQQELAVRHLDTEFSRAINLIEEALGQLKYHYEAFRSGNDGEKVSRASSAVHLIRRMTSSVNIVALADRAARLDTLASLQEESHKD